MGMAPHVDLSSNWNGYHISTLSPFSICLFFYISKIVSPVANGCPLLEYIDLDMVQIENPLHIDALIALSSLLCLRSVFIDMHVLRGVTPKEKEDFCDSIDAIVEQGLLEVRI